MSTTSGLKWFKSSYSGGDGDNCIEVALDAEAIHIRDSKDPRITPLAVRPEAWAAFVGRIVPSCPVI
ncbi:DUF397 domain-containing protein [Streptomyces sp. NPDC048208]|uniref:DUF397 domain-containing protein n=1 Tax=Streptomyces sp. NPDC048208 TaxID=3365515 RepID=UPI0037204878